MSLIRGIFLLFALTVASVQNFAADINSDDEVFDPADMIMEHISDAFEFQILSYTNSQGEYVDISLPLPVILWHDGGLHFFISSQFKKENPVVPIKDTYIRMHHNKIYYTDSSGTILYDEEGSISNKSLLSFSITKNVFSMFVGSFIIFWFFGCAGRIYSKRGGLVAPKGVQSIAEPIVLFIRDDIAGEQIDKDKVGFFVPFLLTLFSFIWFNNLLGLIPFFPGGANLSGNISFTVTLAVMSFLVINIFGSKRYWKDILIAPGVPFFAKIFLIPVEIIGIFTKPFGLMLRLFANMTAGHIIILAITSMIFILKSFLVAPMSLLLNLIMFSLEFLVGILQAYIFTLLTSLFIGIAVNEPK